MLEQYVLLRDYMKSYYNMESSYIIYLRTSRMSNRFKKIYIVVVGLEDHNNILLFLNAYIF